MSPAPTRRYRSTVAGLGRITTPATLTHYRIDERHSNSYAEWKRRGSPAAPDQKLYAQLEKAGGLQLLSPAQSVRIERGSVSVSFDLPRQGVSLIDLQW